MRTFKKVRQAFVFLMLVCLTVTSLPAVTLHAEAAGGKNYVLEALNLTQFAAGAKTDGDSEKAGTDNYFEIIYSAKSKVDTSKKDFEDGYSTNVRINFGGAATTSKNSVKFTTSNPATVKVWWVAGGDNRPLGILNASGEVVTQTVEATSQNELFVSELTLENPGEYYLGGIVNNDYIMKVEVTEQKAEPQMISKTFTETLESSLLDDVAQGAKADGEEEKAGTNGFFTIAYSAKTKVEANAKTFEDGYSATKRINWGGKSDSGKNIIRFTTEAPSTVKIWWVSGGDGRNQSILNAAGETVAATSVSVKNDLYIDTLSIPSAGTYSIASLEGSNYINKVEVSYEKMVPAEGEPEITEPEPVAWSDILAPSITDITAEADKVKVTVSASVGKLLADKLTVVAYNETGDEVTRANSTAEKESHTITLSMTASGKYSYKAFLLREGEETKESAMTELISYDYPLGTPSITGVTNIGNGKVRVNWGFVYEAEKYEVYAEDTLLGETLDTSFEAEMTGFSAGAEYPFYVVAIRGAFSEKSEAFLATYENEEEAEWLTAIYGPSTNSANNGVLGKVKDGSVTVYSENGKGKIVPNSSGDGLAFHYTKIPKDKNFTLSATVTVDSWTFSNGQEGFGIMASDTVGSGTGTVWNNSIMGVATKVEYYFDGEKASSLTTNPKISMKLGIGSIVRLGVTKSELETFANTGAFSGNATTPAEFSANTYTLETSCGANGAGTYNIIAKATKAVDGTVTNPVEKFKLSIRRDNSGYIVSYMDESGNVIGTKRIYDENRDALLQLDEDCICVGFFAARNTRATFSDIELTLIDPSEDESAGEREIEYVANNFAVISAATANKEEYRLTFTANADGKASVVTDKGTVVCEDASVSANAYASFDTVIGNGNTTFTITFTPDEAYAPGEYMRLESYDPIVTVFTVNYREIGSKDGNIYVSPNGKGDGTGTKESPLDIKTALKYVKAGQKIVLAGGKYEIPDSLRIDRGIDGTKESMIYMVADSETSERPVLDFAAMGTGFVAGGNYWYFKGFDVTNTKDGSKGFQASGNNCTFEDIKTYKNGNTGFQISRLFSTDLFENWPSNNLVFNCTSFLNADSGFEDADGFAAKITVGDGNVFDGCLSYYNADDGWDLYAKAESGAIGAVTIKNCVTFKNGYILDENGNEVNAGNGNGFKMGGESIPGAHELYNSVAFLNKAKGFDSNSCPDIHVYDSISFDNESYNVAFYTNNAANTAFVADGVLSYCKVNTTAESIKLKGTQNEALVKGATNYYWDGEKSANAEGTTVSDNWFVSLEFKGIDSITRNADGSLNMGDFLKLTSEAYQKTKAGLGSMQPSKPSSEETPSEGGTQPSYENNTPLSGESVNPSENLITDNKATVTKTPKTEVPGRVVPDEPSEENETEEESENVVIAPEPVPETDTVEKDTDNQENQSTTDKGDKEEEEEVVITEPKLPANDVITMSDNVEKPKKAKKTATVAGISGAAIVALGAIYLCFFRKRH